MKSRRKVFRYGEFQIPVTFKTQYEEGKAELVNISTGGCALNNVTISLGLGDIFLLTIETDNMDIVIEAKAIVLRVIDTKIAARFIRISDNAKYQLRHYFSHELRNRNR